MCRFCTIRNILDLSTIPAEAQPELEHNLNQIQELCTMLSVTLMSLQAPQAILDKIEQVISGEMDIRVIDTSAGSNTTH